MQGILSRRFAAEGTVFFVVEYGARQTVFKRDAGASFDKSESFCLDRISSKFCKQCVSMYPAMPCASRIDSHPGET